MLESGWLDVERISCSPSLLGEEATTLFETLQFDVPPIEPNPIIEKSSDDTGATAALSLCLYPGLLLSCLEPRLHLSHRLSLHKKIECLFALSLFCATQLAECTTQGATPLGTHAISLDAMRLQLRPLISAR